MTKTMTNEERYEQKWKTASDANEHLPVLREYASKCQSAVEIGTWQGVTATGLLMGIIDSLQQDKKFTVIDINEDYLKWSKGWLEQFDLGVNQPKLEFIRESSLIVPPVETDMLFIDSLHTYSHCLKELKRHHAGVKKYILLHDVITYGAFSETGDPPGLEDAICDFLAETPAWQWTKTWDHNNGLALLERTSA